MGARGCACAFDRPTIPRIPAARNSFSVVNFTLRNQVESLPDDLSSQLLGVLRVERGERRVWYHWDDISMLDLRSSPSAAAAAWQVWLTADRYSK
jgi:hypothetical protein